MAKPAAVPPVTVPDDTPTEATDKEPLVQVPPVVMSVRLVVAPEQTVAVPDIGAGDVLTVMLAVFEQPSPIV